MPIEITHAQYVAERTATDAVVFKVGTKKVRVPPLDVWPDSVFDGSDPDAIKAVIGARDMATLKKGGWNVRQIVDVLSNAIALPAGSGGAEIEFDAYVKARLEHASIDLVVDGKKYRIPPVVLWSDEEFEMPFRQFLVKHLGNRKLNELLKAGWTIRQIHDAVYRAAEMVNVGESAAS